MGPKVIINWTVRRSGATMTIDGTDKNAAEAIKITGVASIECPEEGARALATTEDGTEYELA